MLSPVGNIQEYLDEIYTELESIIFVPVPLPKGGGIRYDLVFTYTQEKGNLGRQALPDRSLVFCRMSLKLCG